MDYDMAPVKPLRWERPFNYLILRIIGGLWKFPSLKKNSLILSQYLYPSDTLRVLNATPTWKAWGLRETRGTLPFRAATRSVENDFYKQGRGKGLPIFGNTKISAFSTNGQSWLSSAVLEGVLGPLLQAQHTWGCQLKMPSKGPG